MVSPGNGDVVERPELPIVLGRCISKVGAISAEVEHDLAAHKSDPKGFWLSASEWNSHDLPIGRNIHEIFSVGGPSEGRAASSPFRFSFGESAVTGTINVHQAELARLVGTGDAF